MNARRVLQAGYVAVVVALAFIGEIDPNHPRPVPVIAAVVLSLPLVIVAFPLLYLLLALLWRVTDADRGGSTWMITLIWLVALGLAAMGNVMLFERRRS
ncbi:MAG: hypothetical protein WCI22_12670 [Actinomycetota bacterium]